MSTTKDAWVQVYTWSTAADIEGSYSLGAVELVRREGEEVDAQLAHVERDLPESLSGVGVKGDAVFAAQSSNLSERLEDPYFVICRHDRHQGGVRADRAPQVVQIDEALLVYPEQGDFEAARFELSDRV